MNQVALVGRIVREIELRDVGDEKIVLNNVIAIQRHYRTENGNEADFIPFVVWGKRAELIEEYCDKGDLIGLSGKMQSRSYQNTDQETVYVVEMLVNDVQLLQPKKQAIV
ncbi:single-stranded DNA-binding protein [Marinilactibacillus piezotolerans]|uniref:single-stranded DNA-binding protein n=1 Tax=Marinilactibacillus piezotolerans TaxID=258723 RepID=UPI0009AF449B|nr:single-stranded DNA-binding protein [Marinilactibacillus piezotolerans]